jgi:hypothetical protein
MITLTQLKQALKSRTVILGLCVVGLTYAQTYVLQIDLTPFQQMLAGSGLGSAIVVLRFLTTMPVSEK